MVSKLKILVLGGNGMLGGALLRKFAQNKLFQLAATVRTEAAEFDDEIVCFRNVELSRFSRFEFINEFAPDYVFNCIGDVAKVDGTSASKDQVFLNALLPHILDEFACVNKFHLVHFSTDCVFDGKAGSYDDLSSKNACDYYGQAKSLGEVCSEFSTTIRTSIVGPEFDGGSRGLYEWFKLQVGEVKGFKSALYSGMTTRELANTLETLLLTERLEPGLMTVAGPVIDKFDLLNLFKDR